MPGELHYTADEVRALLEAATPGPWPDWSVTGVDVRDDLPADHVPNRWLANQAPSLAADLLTLHAERERMRAVMLRLAGGCESGEHLRAGLRALGWTRDDLIKRVVEEPDAQDGFVTAEYLDEKGRKIVATALRALAGGAS